MDSGFLNLLENVEDELLPQAIDMMNIARIARQESAFRILTDYDNVVSKSPKGYKAFCEGVLECYSKKTQEIFKGWRKFLDYLGQNPDIERIKDAIKLLKEVESG